MKAMSAALINDAPPIEIPYTEEAAVVVDKLVEIFGQILEPAKERVAAYLADAGIFAKPCGDKCRNGKYSLRYETAGGKRSTVSYDLRTHELAVNGKPIKQN
jgi:hypothetical protein